MDLDWKGFNDVSDAGLRFAERAVDRVERNPVIDAAKGYGILLVVLGHSVYYDSFVFRVIFNFHMPLFFPA